MDDLNLTTTAHVQARWMLTDLTDVASRGRIKFKAVKSLSLSIHHEGIDHGTPPALCTE